MRRLAQIFSRPHAFWLAVPLVLAIGLITGITSVSADEPYTTALPTPPPAIQPPPPRTSAPKPQAQGVAWWIAQFEPRSQAIIVQARNGRFVSVHLQANTIVKLGVNRVRPREMKLGDNVVVVGKRNEFGGVNATLITIKPRPTPR